MHQGWPRHPRLGHQLIEEKKTMSKELSQAAENGAEVLAAQAEEAIELLLNFERPTPGVLPIIDGPWQGQGMEHAFMTFEADGEDIGCPLTSGQPGNGRVRYFCQQDGDGNWVWSITRPSNADLLMQAEFAECKRIGG